MVNIKLKEKNYINEIDSLESKIQHFENKIIPDLKIKNENLQDILYGFCLFFDTWSV